MEVLIRRADLDAKAVGADPEQQLPPLVFIHGRYHAAWCWADKWMPYLSALGFDCFAISILGQGGSDVPNAPVAGTVQSHAADVSNVIRQLVGRPPVLVGHSFGGLIVQAYLADVAKDWESSKDDGVPFAPLTGAVLACSVPPTGNMELVKRYMCTRPILSIKITLSLAAKLFRSSLALCRDSFFSPALPEAEVKRYQALLSDSSKLPLFDLRLLNASLPVAKPPAYCPPVMVLGAADDVIVRYQALLSDSSKLPLFDLRRDDQGLQETAESFSTAAVALPGTPHDLMLDLGWKDSPCTCLLIPPSPLSLPLSSTNQDDQGVKETAEFFSTAAVVLPGMPHDIMLDLGWKDGRMPHSRVSSSLHSLHPPVPPSSTKQDDQGVRETAEFFNTEAVVLPGMPHDVMLDLGWKDAADSMLQWLASHGAIPKQ
ncbi:unnamed protein product [Closterium sp. Naga37s-1]|nr:unnamed protein product [Closterium sp. Naga37s-1]